MTLYDALILAEHTPDVKEKQMCPGAIHEAIGGKLIRLSLCTNLIPPLRSLVPVPPRICLGGDASD